MLDNCYVFEKTLSEGNYGR